MKGKKDADSATGCRHLCEWLRMTEVWHLRASRIWYMSEGREWCRDKLHWKIIEKFYLTITFYFFVMWIIPVWAERAFEGFFVAVHKFDVFSHFFDDPSTLLTFVFGRLGCRGRVVNLSDSPKIWSFTYEWKQSFKHIYVFRRIEFQNTYMISEKLFFIILLKWSIKTEKKKKKQKRKFFTTFWKEVRRCLLQGYSRSQDDFLLLPPLRSRGGCLLLRSLDDVVEV